MQPVLSIIVPCYGVEKYLDRCLKSLTEQTLLNFEIILIDDESPDRVPQMCDQWVARSEKNLKDGKSYPQIKVVHKKNGGLGYARNSGLEIARGEYVAFVDSDDFVDVNMYKTLYEKAKLENADVVYCNCSVYKSPSSICPRMDVCKETTFSGRDEIRLFLLDVVGPEPSYPHDVKYMMSVWHAVYRRKVIVDNGINFVSERELVSEDLVFDIDYLQHCCKIVYLPDCFYYYCDNENSLSKSVDISKYERIKKFDGFIERKLKKIFLEDEFKMHFYRLKFLHLRYFISCCKNKLIPLSMRDVLDDPSWKDLFSFYDYKKMDLKHRLYFLCCKWKVIMLLKLFA